MIRAPEPFWFSGGNMVTTKAAAPGFLSFFLLLFFFHEVPFLFRGWILPTVAGLNRV